MKNTRSDYTPEEKQRIKEIRIRQKELRLQLTELLVRKQLDAFEQRHGFPWTPTWCEDHKDLYERK